MFIFWHYRKVLLLLCQLPFLTIQDDEEKKCPSITITEAKDHLRLNGGGPLGTYNENYMAFTLDEVRRNFKNLLTMQPGNFSALAAWAPLSFPATMSSGSCVKDSGGCEGCPGLTNLGPGYYPQYLNQVNCESSRKTCGVNGQQGKGQCRSTVMRQRFFKDVSTSLPACNKDPEEYHYDMNMCCQCVLL